MAFAAMVDAMIAIENEKDEKEMQEESGQQVTSTAVKIRATVIPTIMTV